MFAMLFSFLMDFFDYLEQYIKNIDIDDTPSQSRKPKRAKKDKYNTLNR